MRAQVQRLRSVDVYECDGPGCPEICDEGYNPWRCGWVDIGSQFFREPGVEYTYAHDHPRLYFCSWCCAANWMRLRAIQADCTVNGERVAA